MNLAGHFCDYSDVEQFVSAKKQALKHTHDSHDSPPHTFISLINHLGNIKPLLANLSFMHRDKMGLQSANPEFEVSSLDFKDTHPKSLACHYGIRILTALNFLSSMALSSRIIFLFLSAAIRFTLLSSSFRSSNSSRT